MYNLYCMYMSIIITPNTIIRERERERDFSLLFFKAGSLPFLFNCLNSTELQSHYTMKEIPVDMVYANNSFHV